MFIQFSWSQNINGKRKDFNKEYTSLHEFLKDLHSSTLKSFFNFDEPTLLSESKNEGNSKNKSFNEDAIKETNLIDLDRYNKYIKDQEKVEEEKREKRNELKKELSNLMEAKRYVESHLRDFPNDLLAREDLEKITTKVNEIQSEIKKIEIQ